MIRIGVMADIHGNLPALETALTTLIQERVDEIVVCGDVVGYGHSPNECCELLREYNCLVLAGNHDWAVAGKTEYRLSHSKLAIKGIEYTKKVITDENRAWLKDLRLIHRLGELTFVHAALFEPQNWRLLRTGQNEREVQWDEVRQSFDRLQGQVCFVGHSHSPALYLEEHDGIYRFIPAEERSYSLDQRRTIIDVGSVGYPRNKFDRSSLVVYDLEANMVCYQAII